MAAMSWSRAQGSEGSEQTAPSQARERVIVGLVVTSVLAAFVLVPLGVAVAASGLVGSGIGAALVEGLVRLVLFVAYLAMLSRLPGIRRTLEYHGAEHMVIAAFEQGSGPRHEQVAGPTVADARAHSVRHPRCGTDFFLLIFVISIVAFALVGRLPAVWLVGSRIALAPVVVGVAYEVLRAGGTSTRPGLSRALSAPGLWLQRFTTAEPTDDQIEVAIAALAALDDSGSDPGHLLDSGDGRRR